MRFLCGCAAAAGDIDYWTIVDTGSTDGTQATIDATMAGIPGQRLSQDFVDFSTTRNYALQVWGQLWERPWDVT